MNTVDENRVAKKKQSGKIRKKGQIDWMITLLPLGLIAALSILLYDNKINHLLCRWWE